MDGACRLLRALGLLALLLALDPPAVRTSNRIRRQGKMSCHVCEAENSFSCLNAVECTEEEIYCNLMAVKTYARFFHVSKQCSTFCPHRMSAVNPEPKLPKSFVLEKPTPFFYAHCCKGSLCNAEAPQIKNESMFREQADRASVRNHSHAILLVLMASAATSAGLSLL